MNGERGHRASIQRNKRENITRLLHGDFFRCAAPELHPLNRKPAVFNPRRQRVKAAWCGTAEDRPIGCVDTAVAGTLKMAARGVPGILTAEMGANGGEDRNVGITVLDGP